MKLLIFIIPFIINLIIPFIMILVGNIIKKHPVNDMKRHTGYNTPTSRKSQAHWNYAQSIAPIIFISVGKISLVVILILSILLQFLNISVNVFIYSGVTAGFIFLIIAFYQAEKQIKMKFPN